MWMCSVVCVTAMKRRRGPAMLLLLSGDSGALVDSCWREQRDSPRKKGAQEGSITALNALEEKRMSLI